MVGYPLAYERRCSGTTDKCPQCRESRLPTLPLPVQSTVAQPVRNTPARAPQRYQNCSRPSPHNHPGYRELVYHWTNDPNSSAITVQIGWFQVLKGYIPEDWTSMRIPKRGVPKVFTRPRSEFPDEGSPINPAAPRLRQAAQQRVETAYARTVRAHDRRILEVPLEERLKHALPHCAAKTMLPATQSVHDASTQIKTGHQDIRSYFSSNTSHHG
jgi:hypothetical protein